MRHLTIIVSIALFGCKQKTVDTNLFTKTIWISAETKFDTLRFDTTSYIVHGFATLLRFDTTQKLKALSNDFYLVNDTITWGEPLADFDIGTWTVTNDKILSATTYIQGSATKFIGTQKKDIFIITGDTLVRASTEKFVKAPLLSREISELFNKEWPHHDKKNGK